MKEIESMVETDSVEVTSRYEALGMEPPDPETMCLGDCEGTGLVPIPADETDPEYRALWRQAHENFCTKPLAIIMSLLRTPELWYWKSLFTQLFTTGSVCDGWHFVKCPRCNGTGKK